MWLPVWSEWVEKRRAWVREACAGLRAVGVEARIDRLGDGPDCIELLRANAPSDSLEAAEDWLLRIVEPHADAPGEDDNVNWAGNVEQMLLVRWPEYSVWSGAAADPFLKKLECLPPTECVRRGRFSMTDDGNGGRVILALPRGLTEVVRCLPDVRIDGPTQIERPHEWVAIDAAGGANLQALRAFEHGLQARGFATCRYEWNGTRGVGAALTVHAGSDTLDQLEARLAIALRDETAPWRARYVPWTWTPSIWIHVVTGPTCWQRREWLETQLGGAHVEAMALQSDWTSGAVLKVGAAYVDRALELVRGDGGL